MLCHTCVSNHYHVTLTRIRYTSSSGERRIRVHTAAAPVVSDLGEMYRQADSGAIVSMMSKLGNLSLLYIVFFWRHLIYFRNHLIFFCLI